MIEVRQTEGFSNWLAGLNDERAKARIAERVRRLALGLTGDVKPVGDGVSELRIDYGPGYRVYYVVKGPVVTVLLSGGTKRSQKRDIVKAKELALTA